MSNVVSNELIQRMREKYPTWNISEYALFDRDYDNSQEVLGLVSDPTIDPSDFYGREMLFPKRWVTLDVLQSGDA